MQRAGIPIIWSAVFAALWLLAVPARAAVVEDIRLWAEDGKTRVVLDLSAPADHTLFTLPRPDRVVVDVRGSRLAERLISLPAGDGHVRAIRVGRRGGDDLRIVLDLDRAVRPHSFSAGPKGRYGDRLVIDLAEPGVPQAVKTVRREAAAPPRDLVIAIDPGHGGRDPGAIGKGRTREKDVVLAIARRLAAKIDAEPGMRAVLVRRDDSLIPLRERMESARRNRADLFVSIHADAVRDARARGSSVWVLSMKGANDEHARRLAAQNNTHLIGGVVLPDEDKTLASVLLDLSQNASLGASLEVGQHVIRELAKVGTVHKRTVQQAGFAVLKSPDVPSILVETAFISNPNEERKLRDADHQYRLAQAILAGIRGYFYANPPPESWIAQAVRERREPEVRHVISRGDTLSEIASRYNVSVSSIRAVNDIAGDRIRIGQVLRIPSDG
jgi:N-acetylmuramoyl-L-alanine amidase